MDVIPQLLLYFVPGYLAIIMFRSVTSTKPKHEHSLFVACAISYLATTLVKAFFPAGLTVIPEYLALTTCIIAVLAAVLVAKLLQCQCVVNFLVRTLHYNPYPTVLASHIRLSHPGTTARVYLDGEDYYVEGTLVNYSNDPDDPYIALRWYRFYELDTSELYYETNNDTKYFIVRMDRVQHIEVWPTIVDE